MQPQPTVLSFPYVNSRVFNIKPGRNATSITFSAKQKQILSHHQFSLNPLLTYQESVVPKHLR